MESESIPCSVHERLDGKCMFEQIGQVARNIFTLVHVVQRFISEVKDGPSPGAAVEEEREPSRRQDDTTDSGLD